MKKNEITHEQWNELSDEEKGKYLETFKKIYGGKNLPSEYSVELPSIKHLNEFLGNKIMNKIINIDKLWEKVKQELKS